MIISHCPHFTQTPTSLQSLAEDHASCFPEKMEPIRRDHRFLPLYLAYLKISVAPSAFLPVPRDQLAIFLSCPPFSTQGQCSNNALLFPQHHFLISFWILPISYKRSILTPLPSTTTNFFAPFARCLKKYCLDWAQWCTLVIQLLEKQRSRGSRFETSLGKKVSKIPSQQKVWCSCVFL
jgi:hypothetical protein